MRAEGECITHPWSLTCPGVSCGHLSFLRCEKYILNTACFHRLKASDFLVEGSWCHSGRSRKEGMFEDENNEFHS